MYATSWADVKTTIGVEGVLFSLDLRLLEKKIES